MGSRASAEPLKVLRLLKKNYPDAHCALHFSNPFELLVATVLSAQCTDERVNKVTPGVFRRWPTPARMSEASLGDLEKALSSVNFYKNKAKNLIQTAKILVQEHQEQVPQRVEELVKLAGVGRKTANVVLGNAFGLTTGIVVDTHVGRVSRRLGWTKFQDPVKIEDDLIKKIPQDDWIMLSHYLIFHGRQVCKARNPQCDQCFLKKICPQK